MLGHVGQVHVDEVNLRQHSRRGDRVGVEGAGTGPVPYELRQGAKSIRQPWTRQSDL